MCSWNDKQNAVKIEFAKNFNNFLQNRSWQIPKSNLKKSREDKHSDFLDDDEDDDETDLDEVQPLEGNEQQTSLLIYIRLVTNVENSY